MRVWWNGRHPGLKILWLERAVSVQVRSPAPDFNQQDLLFSAIDVDESVMPMKGHIEEDGGSEGESWKAAEAVYPNLHLIILWIRKQIKGPSYERIRQAARY